MHLIITEKPSVAKDIAKVLKVTSQKEGYFEGNGYVITWAFGHLVRLADPPAYDPSYEKWNLDYLPIMPDTFIIEVQPEARVKKQFDTISGWMIRPEIETVICATDAGREGELIFRHIYTLSGSKKPIQRLWISSQTDTAIKEGFATLKKGDDYVPLYESAQCRSEADWIVGINATRAYTSRFSRGQGVMSVGRVQTPVLKMIVDRYQAHTTFVPETYYEIEAQIQHENGLFSGLWISKTGESRLTKKEEAHTIVDAVKTASTGNIKSLTEKTVTEKPPLLYDLTEIQKDANRLYKFSAEETLVGMQALYEKHKLLTYPRTSSRYLSNDLKPKMKGLITNVGELAEFLEPSKKLLTTELVLPSRIFDDQKVTDHHAIIPTDKKPELAGLSPEEKQLYFLVLRRFLAAFYPDCLKDQTEIISLFGAHTFRSFGSVIKQMGWRELYQHEKSDAKDEEALLPLVKEQDPITAQEIKLGEKKTKAPPLYTEATLLGAMETAGKNIEDEELRQAMKHCGLGTPATRAQIIERLITVQYVVRDKNKLLATPKGIQLIAYIQDKALLSAELTGNWEKKLYDIVSGTYSRTQYMQDIKTFTQAIIGQVKACTLEATGPIQNPVGTCPLCQGIVGETKMAFSCSQWKASGCTFKIWKTIAQKEISDTLAKELLKNKKTKPLKGFKNKEGSAFVASLAINTEGKVVFEFDPDDLESVGPCPLCEADVVERKMAFGCKNWKATGCSFTVWKDIAGKKITKTLVKTLLKKQETPVQTGFKKRDGSAFEAKLTLQNGRVTLV